MIGFTVSTRGLGCTYTTLMVTWGSSQIIVTSCDLEIGVDFLQNVLYIIQPPAATINPNGMINATIRSDSELIVLYPR